MGHRHARALPRFGDRYSDTLSNPDHNSNDHATAYSHSVVVAMENADSNFRADSHPLICLLGAALLCSACC